MGILLGLLTAVTWGGSDFLARFATHRIGTLRTMFYMQATGLVLLSICLPWLGGWGHLHDGSGWQPWAWGVLAGCINAVSTLTLYRSFEVGKLSVVAPLSASYPALTVILSLLTGEHLRATRGAGIICTMLGVVLVARGEQEPHKDDVEGNARKGKGVAWALCSAWRIWCAVLAVGESRRAAGGRAAGSVDDSFDVRVADCGDFAGGEATG